MGQFEIKGTKKKDLVPDVIILNVYAKVENKNVIDDEKSISDAKDSLKSSVAKLVLDLEEVTNDCIVSFSDLSYSKSSNLFQSKDNSTFGLGKKKQENYINITASTVISIRLSSRDEDILASILKLLLNSVIIMGIYDSFDVDNIEDKYLDLKSEVCKKCRNDAEVIVESLGSEILGVDKIVYNSNGSLLDIAQDRINSSSTIKNNEFDLFNSFDSCECECDDDSLETTDNNNISSIKYDEVWVKGFVKTVLDKKYTVEDSVTVVFSIK